MENAKKERDKKAKVVRRRIKELLNSVKSECHATDVEKKVGTLNNAMEEVGPSHDKVMTYMKDDDAVETEDSWYDELDCEVNKSIKIARDHIRKVAETNETSTNTKIETPQFKLKKIEMSTFDSDHRTYYKWKEQFDRYTKHLDNEMKYDYLLNYTKGDAHK